MSQSVVESQYTKTDLRCGCGYKSITGLPRLILPLRRPDDARSLQ